MRKVIVSMIMALTTMPSFANPKDQLAHIGGLFVVESTYTQQHNSGLYAHVRINDGKYALFLANIHSDESMTCGTKGLTINHKHYNKVIQADESVCAVQFDPNETGQTLRIAAPRKMRGYEDSGKLSQRRTTITLPKVIDSPK